jgi:hypothetical protein
VGRVAFITGSINSAFQIKQKRNRSMLKILAIDPGQIESAWVLMEGLKIHSCNIEENELIRKALDFDEWQQDVIALEYVVAYGRSGKEVSDTAFEAGRLIQSSKSAFFPYTRSKVRGHLCGSRGSDSKIIEELVRRFTPDTFAKYVNNELSWNKTVMEAKEKYFKDFRKDIWQAYALGVTYYDLNVKGE